MPKTCNQNQKASLKHRKRNDKETKTHTITAQKGSAAITVSILPDGRIVVQDYSHKDERYKLIRHLQKMGVDTETIFDSPCG